PTCTAHSSHRYSFSGTTDGPADGSDMWSLAVADRSTDPRAPVGGERQIRLASEARRQGVSVDLGDVHRVEPVVAHPGRILGGRRWVGRPGHVEHLVVLVD